MHDGEVILSLSHAEAIVFFEWLSRVDNSGLLIFNEQAEQISVWRVEGKLEKALENIFSSEYLKTLEESKTILLQSNH